MGGNRQQMPRQRQLLDQHRGGLEGSANALAIAKWSALTEGELVDFQVANFPVERLARNAEPGGRAAGASNPAVGLPKRRFDQHLLAVVQASDGRSIRPLTRLAT